MALFSITYLGNFIAYLRLTLHNRCSFILISGAPFIYQTLIELYSPPMTFKYFSFLGVSCLTHLTLTDLLTVNSLIPLFTYLIRHSIILLTLLKLNSHYLTYLTLSQFPYLALTLRGAHLF